MLLLSLLRVLCLGVTGRSSLLPLLQAVLQLWDAVGSQHIQVEQVVLQAGWQRQLPDHALRAQALAPQQGPDLQAAQVGQGRKEGWKVEFQVKHRAALTTPIYLLIKKEIKRELNLHFPK